MSARSRTRYGPLACLLTLGLSLGAGCGDDQEGDPPDTGATTTGGPSTNGDTSGGDTTTSGADSSSGGGGGGESTTTGEADSTGEAIDPNLDRSAPNILDDPNLCGYPGPGPNGYGGLIETNRFPNFVLEDCDGNQREFAEFFCERDDPDYMDYNKVFVVVFETVW